MESSKLTRASGEPLKALQELENSLLLAEGATGVIDLTDDGRSQHLHAKVR